MSIRDIALICFVGLFGFLIGEKFTDTNTVKAQPELQIYIYRKSLRMVSPLRYPSLVLKCWAFRVF